MPQNATQEYKRVPDDEDVDCPGDIDNATSRGPSRLKWVLGGAIVALILSIALNAYLVVANGASVPRLSRGKSLYAMLETGTVERKIFPHEEFVDETNLTGTSSVWEALSGDPGVVALADEFVSAKGLPTAMRYPWDSTKGVYLLQSFHNLHCLRTVYRSIMDYHFERRQRIALVHILHCLDELRQDVICHADDTPRYAGLQTPEGTGKGQTKVCNDWDALERWALLNTACFQHEDEVPDRMVNRFKHCPDGAQPWLEGNAEEGR